jgi:hypothetical protein
MAPSDHPFYNNLMTIITDLISDISAAQTAYFNANGRYFQGIKTPATPQTGTTLGDVIDETAKPTDQLEDWVTFAPQTFKKNSKLPYQISIDTYEAPSGHGWIFTGELWYDDLGPDAYGNMGSHLVYRHHEGTEPQDGIFDELYIQPDSEEI